MSGESNPDWATAGSPGRNPALTLPPKRLLAMDGGGVYGGFSIGVLGQLERVLRERIGKPDLVLADYFDFIGGTSIGSVIGSALSIGMSVQELQEFATENIHEFFRPILAWRRFWHKYSGHGMAACLRKVFGDIELGAPEIRTLLMIVLRNAVTDSPWIVTNNPCARYNDPVRGDCNLRIPLWQLLRGSAAAPTFFPCETIRLNEREFHFVDGAGTIANNPSFQLFLQATLPEYGLAWPTGTDKLLLVSIGTGLKPTKDTARANMLSNAIAQIHCLLAGASVEQDLLCRLFGECRTGDPIDREVGDLINSRTSRPKQFSYCRYNIEFSPAGLALAECPPRLRRGVVAIDDVTAFGDLLKLGEMIGKARIQPCHFDGFIEVGQDSHPVYPAAAAIEDGGNLPAMLRHSSGDSAPGD